MKKLVLILLLLSSPAFADDLGVGFYAPSAPFAGTSARLDYVTRLADHLGEATGQRGVAKVYSRAGDFAAAIKSGEIQVAVVDAAYLAAGGGGYSVLATATRGGDDEVAWQLVTRGSETTILALQGKKVLCPALGGHESDFVIEALLGGEVGKSFVTIETSPDTSSAVAALGLGRADVAVLPSSVDLPSGTTVVANLPRVSLPVLVALPGASDAVRKKVAAAAVGWSGGDVLDGFRAGGDAERSLAHRFGHAARRGPMVIPNLRVAVDELVAARVLAIVHVDLASLLAPPPPLPDP